MGICAAKSNVQEKDFNDDVDEFLFSKLDLEESSRLKSIIKNGIQRQSEDKISMNDLCCLPKEVESQLSEAEKRLIKIYKDTHEKRKTLIFDINEDTNALIQQFEQNVNSPQKCVLVIGISGQGKSTFINSFANYLNGHYDLQDKLRTRLIIPPQNTQSAGSVTKNISAYRQNCNGEEIILIDTPGLRDTKGSDQDTKIVNDLSEYIMRLKRIDLICIVSESQENYIIKNNILSDNQLCIARVLKLFGKSIAKKMVHILTFSDFGNLKYSNFIDNQSLFKIQMENISSIDRKDYFYQFQNSVTYCQDIGIIEKLQFGKNLINYKLLFKKLTDDFLSNQQDNKGYNLEDTHEVLKIRTEETLTIDEITQKLQVYKEIQKNISLNKRQLLIAQSNIEQSQNFKYVQKIPFVEQRECDVNFYVTNCNICHRTCHSKCEYSDDISKQNCFMMKQKQQNSKPQCVICDHNWDDHKNSKIIYYVIEKDVECTYEDMKKKYDKASNTKEVFQSALEDEKKRGNENKEIIREKLDQLRGQIQKLYDSVLFKINHDQNTNDLILSKFPKFQELIKEIEAELNQDSNLQSE